MSSLRRRGRKGVFRRRRRRLDLDGSTWCWNKEDAKIFRFLTQFEGVPIGVKGEVTSCHRGLVTPTEMTEASNSVDEFPIQFHIP